MCRTAGCRLRMLLRTAVARQLKRPGPHRSKRANPVTAPNSIVIDGWLTRGQDHPADAGARRRRSPRRGVVPGSPSLPGLFVTRLDDPRCDVDELGVAVLRELPEH